VLQALLQRAGEREAHPKQPLQKLVAMRPMACSHDKIWWAQGRQHAAMTKAVRHKAGGMQSQQKQIAGSEEQANSR